jgi:PRC-barrel domain
MGEFSSAYEWEGRTVVDADGEKIGKIEAIYLEYDGRTPAWALVKTGLFGSKSSFVPLVDAAPVHEDVEVSVSKDQVADAPRVDADEELSADEAVELYRHYDIDYTAVRDRLGETAVDVILSRRLARAPG